MDKLIKTVQQDDKILALFLYGSRARNDGYKESDVDICLVMKHNSYAPIELSRKKLEYASLFNLDIQIFQQLPIYIRMRIIKEGKLLFCADEDEMYQIAFRAISEFSDYEHIYRDYLKEIARAG